MLYPLTFEGFGLPVVEAMLRGLPWRACDLEPLHSIVAGAAIEFPPADVGGILSAMHRMTGDTEGSCGTRKETGGIVHLGREPPAKRSDCYRSRSSSWIFASVLASRYFTMTGV